MFRPTATEAVALGECPAGEGATGNPVRTLARHTPPATGLLIPRLSASDAIERESGHWVEPYLAELYAARILRHTDKGDPFELIDTALQRTLAPSLKAYDDHWNYVYCSQFDSDPTSFNVIVHPTMGEAFPVEPVFRKLGAELANWVVFVMNDHPYIAGPSVWGWWLKDYGVRRKKAAIDDGNIDAEGMEEFEPDPEAQAYIPKLRKLGFDPSPGRPQMSRATALRRIARRDRKLAEIVEALLYRAPKGAVWSPAPRDTEPMVCTYFKAGDATHHAIDAIEHDLNEGAMSWSNDCAVFEGTVIELRDQMKIAEKYLGPVFALARWSYRHTKNGS